MTKTELSILKENYKREYKESIINDNSYIKATKLALKQLLIELKQNKIIAEAENEIYMELKQFNYIKKEVFNNLFKTFEKYNVYITFNDIEMYFDELQYNMTDDEKKKMCEIVSESGADFIKTSTGFSTAGATREDVALFAKYVTGDTKIKAAGGIASLADAEDFIKLGADRLGTSRIVKLVKNEEASGY